MAKIVQNDETNKFITKARKKHGDKYDYSLVKYINSRTKIKIICPTHGEFEQRVSSHLEGKGCPKCANKHKTTDDIILQFKEVHGNEYDYSLVKYENARTKVKIICLTHGEFDQTPSKHLRGQGCPKCANNGTKLTTNDFTTKAKNVHGDKYDYSLVKYVNNHTKVKIICPEHGEFEQQPNNHLQGKGCYKCKFNSFTDSTSKFIIKAKKKHGNKYDYSLIKYIDSKTKVKIICPIHGVFEQSPDSHLRGHGCLRCSNDNQLLSKELLIKRIIKKHSNIYDLSNINYIGINKKINIKCLTHGEFNIRPDHLLAGQGCPKCSNNGPSKPEIEINEYLNSIGITGETNNRTVLNGFELDIFIPSHSIAIEFNGLYWHNELHKNNTYHLNKTELCEKQNIQLIHVFEDEWLFKKNIVKSRLKNILGLTENKIYGRKTIIKEVKTKEARQFFEENHLQGYTNSKIKLGLYYNNELASCMLFTKPRIGIGSSYDGYELARFANKLDTNILGGASKLLKYFENEYQPKEIKSYADRRWSQGSLYETLGFKLSHINGPNYWYIIGQQRKHRFGFRKNKLKELGFDIKDKTEHQIMLNQKIYRIYDCGTITYKKVYYE